ncbi:MAG: ribonuclease PH, partial [Planctomycetes bacterium]|nr:ribonuclease PH [Planctomycetota bacterium]
MRRSTRTSREKPLARHDGRKAADLRPIEIVRGYTENAAGSVLIRAGKTMVLCTASWEQGVPRWKTGQGTGWVTAEYDMLPGSTSERKRRNRNKVDGRTQEIQRLIGRSMRSVVDLKVLGENSILIDCDVLQADGGTRTASITGAYIALCDAIKMARTKKWIKQSPIREPVAAISVGRVNGRMLLDLDYLEDVGADVDMNVVMTGSGRFIEVQGTGEEATFTRAELDKLLMLASRGIKQLVELQK